MAFGMGVNADALASLLMAKGGTTYHCEPLRDLQQGWEGRPQLAASAAGLQVLRELRGVSVAAMDLDVKLAGADPKPDVRSIDGLVTISAESPRNLLFVLSTVLPGPPKPVPDDGTPTEFDVPGWGVGPLKVAIKGQHIVAWVGPKA